MEVHFQLKAGAKMRQIASRRVLEQRERLFKRLLDAPVDKVLEHLQLDLQAPQIHFRQSCGCLRRSLARAVPGGGGRGWLPLRSRTLDLGVGSPSGPQADCD